MGEARAADDATAPRSKRTAVSANDLDVAVARGIITAEQRERLLAMRAGDVPESGEAAAQRGGLSYVTIGYWAGSIAVLFALGWFLVDRWKSLRPAGVLAVALLYAVSFALSSAFLNRLGYRIAASLLAVLTVGMAPVVAWCVESLLGVWPAPAIARDFWVVDVIGSVRWIPVELSLSLAALIVLRRVRFGLLVLAVVIPAGIALVHLTPWLFDPELTPTLSGWMMIVAAAFMFIAAFAVDRRLPNDPEDYAGWVHFSALGFLVFGVMSVADQSRLIQHMLPVVVLLLVTLGFALRRRQFLLPALLFFIGYLAWLAQEVFPTAVGFMLVMLSVGVVLILGTVLLQRTFPALLHRLSGEGGRRAPRALAIVFPALAALAVVLLVTSVPRARDRLQMLQERRNTQYRQRVERERAQARQRVRQSGETKKAEEPYRKVPAPP